MAIYHLAWASDWRRGQRHDGYRADSLATEGFIHCTKEPEKILEVAGLFFNAPRAEDLLIVALDEGRIASPVKYEDPGCGHLFPHVYGPIPLAAVTAIRRMRKVDGQWALPEL